MARPAPGEPRGEPLQIVTLVPDPEEVGAVRVGINEARSDRQLIGISDGGSHIGEASQEIFRLLSGQTRRRNVRGEHDVTIAQDRDRGDLYGRGGGDS